MQARESVTSASEKKEKLSPHKTYGSFKCGAAPRELIERRPYSSGPFMPPYKVATDATVIPRTQTIYLGDDYKQEREKTSMLLNKS